MTDVEKAMRFGPIHSSEAERVALLNEALKLAAAGALDDAARYFEEMVRRGDTEPLAPGAVAALIREQAWKGA